MGKLYHSPVSEVMFREVVLLASSSLGCWSSGLFEYITAVAMLPSGAPRRYMFIFTISPVSLGVV